jgi:hypothetical protein
VRGWLWLNHVAFGGGWLFRSFLSFLLFCGRGQLLISFFLLSAGTKGSGWELRNLAGSPGGGGVFRLCHTLVRVNTV